jgi:branched-chain amino acid transport system permease protein
VLGIAIVCLFVMYRLEHSRIGMAWKTIHTDIALARSVGIDVGHYRSLAFVAGSMFAGIAGALQVHRLGAVDPHNFSITTMIYLIIWVVVGGTATFWGPIAGVTVITIAFEWTRPLLEWRPLIFGAILILSLIFMPRGLESLAATLRVGRRQTGQRAVGAAPEPAAKN